MIHPLLFQRIKFNPFKISEDSLLYFHFQMNGVNRFLFQNVRYKDYNVNSDYLWVYIFVNKETNQVGTDLFS